MSSKRKIFLAASTLFVLAVLTAGAQVADLQKQTDEPFIKIREVTLGDPHPCGEGWIPYFTDAIYKKYALANWDIDKLRTYMDMLKAFGFNSVQLFFSLVELAKEAIDALAFEKAIQYLDRAKVFPHNLEEGKLQGAQENDINYWLGCAYDKFEKKMQSNRILGVGIKRIVNTCRCMVLQ